MFGVLDHDFADVQVLDHMVEYRVDRSFQVA
jgi:hypothetical protein